MEEGLLIPQEIIEFPCVVYDIKNNKIDRTKDFKFYCKPATEIKITDFCTKLTGIKQEQVDSGLFFAEVLREHKKWMISNKFLTETNKLNKCMFVTCGDWDFKTALQNYCKFLNIRVPKYLTSWCNIKILFSNFYKMKSGGMASMLTYLKIKLEGRHHCGLDDCYNIAQIAQKMCVDGCVFTETNTV